ncbi:MAG: VTT domain-containing protein [Pelovirga sp.]
MDSLIPQLILHLPDGGTYYLLIFLVAFAESIPAAGLIVPGSTIIVLAGLLVVANQGDFTLLALAATLGALFGDLFSLWLGKRYGRGLLHLHIFRRRRRLIRYSQKFFIAHGGKSLFFARFIGPIRGIVPFIAGLSRIPTRAACIYIFISAVLWGISYPAIGYLGANSFRQAQSMGARFGLVILVLLLAVIGHYQVKKLFR